MVGKGGSEVGKGRKLRNEVRKEGMKQGKKSNEDGKQLKQGKRD